MAIPVLGRLAAALRAFNNGCLFGFLAGNGSCAGLLDVEDMSDDRKRDLGLLDGRPTYRRS